MGYRMKYDEYRSLVESMSFSLNLDGTLQNWEFTVDLEMNARLLDIVETCGGMNVLLSVGDVSTNRFCSVLLRSLFKVRAEVPKWTLIPRWIRFDTAEWRQIELMSASTAKMWVSHVLPHPQQRVLNPPSMFTAFLEEVKL